MDVSIVIVNYNTKDFLKECIESIRSETLCNYEIIVVDNASTDHSPSMIRGEYPNVKLIQNSTNIGFAAANNQGFKIAKGRYLLMLNTDTLIIRSAIDRFFLPVFLQQLSNL